MLGLGHALWLGGFLQIFSNFGYLVLASSDVNRPLLIAAMAALGLAVSLAPDRRQSQAALAIRRGVCRRLRAEGYALVTELTLACGKGYRVPEPTRQADLLAERAKSHGEQEKQGVQSDLFG